MTEPTPKRKTPHRRRRWLLAALAAAVVLAGGYVVVKHLATWSLASACREAMRAGDWDRLDGLADRWLWWDKGQAAPWIYRAEVAQQRGDLEQTVAYLERLPDSDPMTPRALLEQSNLLFGPLNRPIDGAKSCERALRLDSHLTEAYRRLIYFYAYTLQRQKMVQKIHEALENDCDLPETYVYLIAQDWLSFANAYDENTKWLAGAPDQELFQVAQVVYGIKVLAFREKGNVRDTGERDPGGEPYHKKLMDGLLKRFPNNREVQIYFLMEASKSGKVEEVVKLLAAAPPEAMQDNRYWRYKGWVHSAIGQLFEAEAAYLKALELNPYDAVTHHQLASVYRKLNRPEQVEFLSKLAREGQELRRAVLLGIPDVASAPKDMLWRMARYAQRCGDQATANKLFQRLEAGQF